MRHLFIYLFLLLYVLPELRGEDGGNKSKTGCLNWALLFVNQEKEKYCVSSTVSEQPWCLVRLALKTPQRGHFPDGFVHSLQRLSQVWSSREHLRAHTPNSSEPVCTPNSSEPEYLRPVAQVPPHWARVSLTLYAMGCRQGVLWNLDAYFRLFLSFPPPTLVSVSLLPLGAYPPPVFPPTPPCLVLFFSSTWLFSLPSSSRSPAPGRRESGGTHLRRQATKARGARCRRGRAHA